MKILHGEPHPLSRLLFFSLPYTSASLLSPPPLQNRSYCTSLFLPLSFRHNFLNIVFISLPSPRLSVSVHPSGFLVAVGFRDRLRLMNVLLDGMTLFKELQAKQVQAVRSCDPVVKEEERFMFRLLPLLLTRWRSRMEGSSWLQLVVSASVSTVCIRESKWLLSLNTSTP